MVARKLKCYLDSMAVSVRHDIIRSSGVAQIKTEPQQKPYSVSELTPRRWKIGEGFMRLDNMFLVRLDSVSKGSWQPEIWVMDPTM